MVSLPHPSIFDRAQAAAFTSLGVCHMNAFHLLPLALGNPELSPWFSGCQVGRQRGKETPRLVVLLLVFRKVVPFLMLCKWSSVGALPMKTRNASGLWGKSCRVR